MTFKIYYHKSGHVEIEAETEEEAIEKFCDLDDSTLEENCFRHCFELDDIEKGGETA